MNTQRLRQVRRLFDRPDIPRRIVRHNMRSWVKSVRYLGDKWVLAQPINRVPTEPSGIRAVYIRSVA